MLSTGEKKDERSFNAFMFASFSLRKNKESEKLFL
jgi:hypothetical protein